MGRVQEARPSFGEEMTMEGFGASEGRWLLLRGKQGALGGMSRGGTWSDVRHCADRQLCGDEVAEAASAGGSGENGEWQLR